MFHIFRVPVLRCVQVLCCRLVNPILSSSLTSLIFICHCSSTTSLRASGSNFFSFHCCPVAAVESNLSPPAAAPPLLSVPSASFPLLFTGETLNGVSNSEEGRFDSACTVYFEGSFCYFFPRWGRGIWKLLLILRLLRVLSLMLLVFPVAVLAHLFLSPVK